MDACFEGGLVAVYDLHLDLHVFIFRIPHCDAG